MITSFFHSPPSRGCRLLLAMGLLMTLPAGPKLEAAGVVTHRSKNFILHTDDGPARAKQLLEQLERMLGIVSSTQWARSAVEPPGHLRFSKVGKFVFIVFATINSGNMYY